MFLIIALVVVCICITLPIYRFFKPLQHFPITDKLFHCVIGHRAAPIINISPNTTTIQSPIDQKHTTTDYTKGVFDKNGFIIPENTLPSFELAKESGVVTVELDVQFTRDRQCVVFHDQIIGNTLQCREEQKSLRICDLDYDDLHQMPFLTTINNITSPYQHARLTLFGDVLKFCHSADMNIMIEIKPQPKLYECCQSIVELIQQYKMEDNIYIASFSPLAGIFVRMLSSTICTGFLFTPIASSTIKSELERQQLEIPLFLRLSITCWIMDTILIILGHPATLWLTGFKIVAPHFSYLSPYTVAQYRSWGITVLTWTVNDPAVQKYLFEQLKATIITDHPTTDLVIQGSDVATKHLQKQQTEQQQHLKQQ